MKPFFTMNRQILRIAIPSIISNITVPLLGMVDMGISGHLGSTVYIGAIAIGSMIFNMLYWLFNFLRMGTGGFTSQAYGRGDKAEALRVLARSLLVAGAVSTLLIAAQLPLVDFGLLMMKASGEVAVQARLYFHILIWGAPAVLGLYSFTGWFLGMQDAKVPMLVAIVQNVCNILLSASLVLFLHWKVAGVAVGTLVAQYVGLLLFAGFWWRRYRADWRQVDLRRLWQGGVLARFFSVNTDIFFRTLCIVAVQVAFTSIGSGLGVVILSANALLLQFNTLLSYVMDGFAYAGEALGGRYYGMGDRAAFLRLTRALIRWCAGLALCFSVAYIIGGDALIRLLTNDAATIEAARRYVVYVCLIPIVGTAGFLLDGLFIGTTATRGMLLSVFSGVVFFFFLQFLLVNLWGNDGLWVAFAGYFLVRGLVQAFYFKRILPPMQQEAGRSG